MGFEYLTNEPLERALEKYLALLKKNGMAIGTERIATSDASGRTSAGAVYANICAPHYDASAMDGIALDARVTFGATETTPVTLDAEQYVTVDTGDPLPEGCDAVVMIEDVVRSDDKVTLYSAAAPWQHVRQVGEDICAGDMIIPSYTRITPAAVGAMLAGGVMSVEVLARPKVALIPTGDEIVPPSENPARGDIIEFNSSIFSGMLDEWGAQAVTYPIVKDKFDDIVAALEKAADECDMVIINAGSSAGREDFSTCAIAEIGEVALHGIAIKPGKPAILGACGAKPVIGVPGYPVSGIIVMEKLVKPVLDELCRRCAQSKPMAQAALSRRLVSSLKYREFVRARLGEVNGRLVAVPLNRGAGVVSSFVKADGIIDVPQDTEGYEAGEAVNVELLRPMEEIRRMLVVTGSHDPLIDEIADVMKRLDPSAAVASSHVGSMGGIMAVKRGEAHMGGIHLLDEASGVYNIAYLKKYFPQGGVTLIRGVKRRQGLMVAKGNPKEITGIADIARENVRYVNRQRGSGTRVLLDYLLTQNGMNASDIYGYEREESTHTAVAAQIAAGTADAGLGILSAARIYGLDFVFVCNEQYDFLVSEPAMQHPAVCRFIEALKSEELARRLNALGGYELEASGEVIEWN